MFMPSTANSVIASAAGDGRVRIFDVHWSLGSASPKPRSTFTCFTDRAKRLALEPGNPHLLLACSEDGTVHQYDLRQRHDCTRDGSCTPFIRFGQSLNCVTMSQAFPAHIAVAGDHPDAVLFDRRFVTRAVARFRPSDPSVTDTGHVTGLAFSRDGTELAGSWSNSYVYLFGTSGEDGPEFVRRGDDASDGSGKRRRSFQSQYTSAASSDRKGRGRGTVSHASNAMQRTESPSKHRRLEEHDEDGEGRVSDDDDDGEEQPSSKHDSTEHGDHADTDHLFMDAPVHDAKAVFRGHCNVQTVKDVFFVGGNDSYVASGSDDGSAYIWNKKTGRIVQLLHGDSDVVNVIAQHPTLPVIAVSGIDDTVKLFEPLRPLEGQDLPVESEHWDARLGFDSDAVVADVARRRDARIAALRREHARRSARQAGRHGPVQSTSNWHVEDREDEPDTFAEASTDAHDGNAADQADDQEDSDSDRDESGDAESSRHYPDMGNTRSFTPSFTTPFPSFFSIIPPTAHPARRTSILSTTPIFDSLPPSTSVLQHAPAIVAENETRRRRGIMSRFISRNMFLSLVEHGFTADNCHVQ
ncbi:WD40-repeat-containing domain protein [Entophlyctis helioformis]|nr:WD40-repeat-containing domain protein [Entophlyctis helioformis]